MPNRPLVAPQVQSISFDPAAAMQDVASIQINRQRMDDARRKSMASMRMRQLAQQYPDSPLEFVDAVTREFPEEGFALGESYWKGVKENAQAHKAQTESSVANLEVGTRILQAARQNPALYGAAKQWITKMSPEVGGQLSEHYNEQEVDGWLQTGQKTSDFLKAQADAAERLTKQDTRGSVLTLFAGASNPQQWQTAVDLTTRSGLKPLLGLVASEWSPEAQAAAAQASISPEKQADDARAAAAEARQTRQFETTEARQNREFAVTSGIARAQLGVAQGNLKQRIADANKPAGSEVTKLPAAIAEKVAGVEQSAAVLDNLEKIKKDDWIGPIAGRFSQSKIKTPGVTVDADLAEFSADTATLKNAVIKATTGAAMSEPEAQRIMEQIPDLTDKPEMWAAKAKTTRRNLELLRRRMLELSGVPQGPAATTPSAAPKQAKADPLGIR